MSAPNQAIQVTAGQWVDCLDLLGRANRRFEFHKSSQFLIRAENVALTVAAMCINNKDHPPAGIHC
jgi:hypothetical protein